MAIDVTAGYIVSDVESDVERLRDPMNRIYKHKVGQEILEQASNKPKVVKVDPKKKRTKG